MLILLAFPVYAQDETLVIGDQRRLSISGLFSMSRSIRLEDQATLVFDEATVTVLRHVSIECEDQGTLEISRSTFRSSTTSIPPPPDSTPTPPTSLLFYRIRLSIRVDDACVVRIISSFGNPSVGVSVAGESSVQIENSSLRSMALTFEDDVSTTAGSLPSSGLVREWDSTENHVNWIGVQIELAVFVDLYLDC